VQLHALLTSDVAGVDHFYVLATLPACRSVEGWVGGIPRRFKVENILLSLPGIEQ